MTSPSLTVSLNATTGLVDVYTYYANTTATTGASGGVLGWPYQTAVAQGSTQATTLIGDSGGPVLQTSTDYIAGANVVGGVTPYFTSHYLQYPVAGLGTIQYGENASLVPSSGTWTGVSGGGYAGHYFYWAAGTSGQATASADLDRHRPDGRPAIRGPRRQPR